MLSSKQKKSLELLDKFIENTSTQEINSLVEKYSSLGIKGPTFEQYLSELSNYHFFVYKDENGSICEPFWLSEPPEKIIVNNIIKDYPANCGVYFLYTFAK